MEEILNVFEENRKKWEYHFSGYLRKVLPMDKDDVANGVLLKILEAYKNNKIDMDNLSNYMFISYRNHLYGLYNKKRTLYTEDMKIVEENEENDGFIEVFEDENPILKKIEEIIGVNRLKEIISYYEYKLSPKGEEVLNPFTNSKFTEADKKRYQIWRRKIKKYLPRR